MNTGAAAGNALTILIISMKNRTIREMNARYGVAEIPRKESK
jgi:hypothetical protein